MLGILSLVPVIGRLIDSIFGNKSDRDWAKAKILELQLRGQLEPLLRQIHVNVQEGRHKSLFVAGWRPMVGWVCALGFAWHFMLLPIIMFIGATFGLEPIKIDFEMSTLTTVLAAMLGVPMGAFRTYEKMKGIHPSGVDIIDITADKFLRLYGKRFRGVTDKHKEIIYELFDRIREEEKAKGASKSESEEDVLEKISKIKEEMDKK